MRIVNGEPEYKGMMDVWTKIIAKESVFSLWKGFTPLFLRNGPQGVILFVLYENQYKMYKKHLAKSTER